MYQPTAPKFVVQVGPEEWESDGRLFDGMLERMKQLGGPGSFRALLWHQGESDAHQPAGHEIDAAAYRRMMGAADPPIAAPGRMGVPLVSARTAAGVST